MGTWHKKAPAIGVNFEPLDAGVTNAVSNVTDDLAGSANSFLKTNLPADLLPVT